MGIIVLTDGEMLPELQTKLLHSDAKVTVTVHDFPSHKHAQEIGLRQHRADSEAKVRATF